MLINGLMLLAYLNYTGPQARIGPQIHYSLLRVHARMHEFGGDGGARDTLG